MMSLKSSPSYCNPNRKRALLHAVNYFNAKIMTPAIENDVSMLKSFLI